MKIKKLLSLLLAMTMILSMMSFNASAEDNSYSYHFLLRDAATQLAVEGAEVSISTTDGTPVDSWTSGTTAHEVSLTSGDQYTMKVTVPEGYSDIDDFTFDTSDLINTGFDLGYIDQKDVYILDLYKPAEVTLDFVGLKGERVRDVYYLLEKTDEVSNPEIVFDGDLFTGEEAVTVPVADGIEYTLRVLWIGEGGSYDFSSENAGFIFTVGTNKEEENFKYENGVLTVTPKYLQDGQTGVHYVKFVDVDGEPFEVPYGGMSISYSMGYFVEGVFNQHYHGYAAYKPGSASQGPVESCDEIIFQTYDLPEGVTQLYLKVDTNKFDYAVSPDNYYPINSDSHITTVTLYEGLPYHIQVRGAGGGNLPDGVQANIMLTEYASAEDTEGTVLYNGGGNEFNEIFIRLKKNLRYRVDITTPEGYETLEPSYFYFVADGESEIEEGADASVTIDNSRTSISWDYIVVTVEITEPETGGDDGEITIPEGDGSAVINFVDRDRSPLTVAGVYEIERYDDYGSTYEKVGEFDTLSSTWNLSDLEDGTYRISLNDGDSSAEGYCFDNEELYFQMINGTLVTDYNWGRTPYASCGIVLSYEGNTITLEVGSYRVIVVPQTNGINIVFPYEVTDESGAVVMERDSGAAFLTPGDYTLTLKENEVIAQVINYDAVEGGVQFTVYEDYSVSVSDSKAEVVENGTERIIYWSLDAIATTEIQAKATAKGGLFPQYSGLSVEYEVMGPDGESMPVSVYYNMLPENASVYENTWELPVKNVIMTEDGGYQAVDANYYVVGSSYAGPVEFTKNEDDGIWYGEFTGVAHEHTICGLECYHDGEHQMQECIPITQAMVDEGNPFTEEGVYALAENIVADETMEITVPMNLCLNGYNWMLNRSYESQLAFEDGEGGEWGNVNCRYTGDILYNDPLKTETYTVVVYEYHYWEINDGFSITFTADDEEDQNVAPSYAQIRIKDGVTYTVNYDELPEGLEGIPVTFKVNPDGTVIKEPDDAINVYVDDKKIEIYLAEEPKEYTVKAIHYGTQDYEPEELTDLSFTVAADGEEDQTVMLGEEPVTVTLKYEVEYTVTYHGVPEGYLGDSTYFTIYDDGYIYSPSVLFDNEADILTLMLMKEIPEGNNSFTVKLIDEDGQPIVGDGYLEWDYMHYVEEDGYGYYSSLYSVTDDTLKRTGGSTYTWSNLCDGKWNLYFDSENIRYSDSARLDFEIKDGKLVDDCSAFDSDVIEINEETNEITLQIFKKRIAGGGILVDTPDEEDEEPVLIHDRFAYEIRDKENNIVASTAMDQAPGADDRFSGAQLEDGTYTLYLLDSDGWVDYGVTVPKDGIEFRVENYRVVDDEELREKPVEISTTVDAVEHVERVFKIDADTATITVNATLNPAKDESIPENTTVQLWKVIQYSDEDEKSGDAKAVAVSTEAQEFSWSDLQAFEYNEEIEQLDRIYYYVTYSIDGGKDIRFFYDDESYVKFVATIDESGTVVPDEYTITYPTIADPMQAAFGSSHATATAGTTVTLTAVSRSHKIENLKVIATESQLEIQLTQIDVAGIQYTFEMPESNVTISFNLVEIPQGYAINIQQNLIGGSITADVEKALEGDKVTLTIQPALGYSYVDGSIKVTDADGKEITTEAAPALLALDAPTVVTFAMPASEVTVSAEFAENSGSGEDPDPEPGFETPFTVAATLGSATVDVDTSDTDVEVHANDTVVVEVKVKGSAFTNADWTMVYDSAKFELTGETLHTAARKVVSGDNVLAGRLLAPAGETEGDEYADGTVIATYTFKVLSQQKDEVIGIFSITDAHANTYEMAGDLDNYPANTEKAEVTILLVEEAPVVPDPDDDVKIPAGEIANDEKIYNALEQTGKPFVLADGFKEADVTYAIVDGDGSEVTDANELAALDFKTALPSWKDVGTYTYYVKVSGDGLATMYDAATLTITPRELTPSAIFAVDPDINQVTFTPVLEGVVDGSHNGTVTVKYTDAVAGEITKTLNASDFVYDGESTSVYKGKETFVAKAKKSATFTVTLDYIEGVADETAGTKADNYTGGEKTATVEVDKIAADNDTVKSLEDTITNEFLYNAQPHTTVIDETKLPAGWSVESITDAYDGTINPAVTEVGDEKLVKVVFKDETEVYNDVIIYVILKVNPANIRITIHKQEKEINALDPELTYTLEVISVDADDNVTVLLTGKLYSDEDLEKLAIETYRDPGEAAGTYQIHASYVPTPNYKVEIIENVLEIDAPDIADDDNPNAPVKIEIVDLSKGLSNGDVQPDYIAGKRLVLVYTNIDKAFYGYGDTVEAAEKMFDLTDAGYMYVDNNYDENTFTQDATKYAHVYGIVVDAIGDFAATEDHEKLYRNKVIFLGTTEKYAPENIVYDADINLTDELDVNDYSMNNGIYNVTYDRVSYIKSILKADYNHDKIVDTDDSNAVKAVVDTAKTANS